MFFHTRFSCTTSAWVQHHRLSVEFLRDLMSPVSVKTEFNYSHIKHLIHTHSMHTLQFAYLVHWAQSLCSQLACTPLYHTSTDKLLQSTLSLSPCRRFSPFLVLHGLSSTSWSSLNSWYFSGSSTTSLRGW